MRWCLVLLLVSCAHAKLDVGGVDVADLSNAEDARALDVAWQWQPTRFAPDGSAIPPKEDGWLSVDADSLVEPRGGQRLSLVWYRTRITLKDQHAGRRVLVGMSIDDYGEILVDGEVKALANGFNGEVIAEITPSAVIGEVHEILVLGVNAPLGKPPERPMFSNEVFVRRPIRLILDGTLAVPKTASARPGIEPIRVCDAMVHGENLSPEIGDDECQTSRGMGPKWMRYEVSVPDSAWIDVVTNGYAEVWIDNAYQSSSFRTGFQRIYLDAGRRTIDVLLWPAPIAAPAGEPTLVVGVVQ